MIQKSLKEISDNLKKLELDIRNTKEKGNQNDKFVQSMEPFAIDAKSKYDTVDCMYKKMIEVYKDLADFYTIDSKTTIGEFFTDLKTFCSQFKVLFLFLNKFKKINLNILNVKSNVMKII